MLSSMFIMYVVQFGKNIFFIIIMYNLLHKEVLMLQLGLGDMAKNVITIIFFRSVESLFLSNLSFEFCS